MTDDLLALQSQRAQYAIQIRELESMLGTQLKRMEYTEKMGDRDGRRVYEQKRAQKVALLHQLKTRDTALKAQIDAIIRTDGAVELYREIWQTLTAYPNMENLRYRIHVFVRDTYGVYFKDVQGEHEA